MWFCHSELTTEMSSFDILHVFVVYFNVPKKVCDGDWKMSKNLQLRILRLFLD